jgi:hypothetical protein
MLVPNNFGIANQWQVFQLIKELRNMDGWKEQLEGGQSQVKFISC